MKAMFNASNGGRDNSILAKILSGPTHTSVERDFSMFEAVNGGEEKGTKASDERSESVEKGCTS